MTPDQLLDLYRTAYKQAGDPADFFSGMVTFPYDLYRQHKDRNALKPAKPVSYPPPPVENGTMTINGRAVNTWEPLDRERDLAFMPERRAAQDLGVNEMSKRLANRDWSRMSREAMLRRMNMLTARRRQDARDLDAWNREDEMKKIYPVAGR